MIAEPLLAAMEEAFRALIGRRLDAGNVFAGGNDLAHEEV
jgi:hypothetical protein